MTAQPPFRIDAELCVGHGRCYGLAPQAFDSDDMGHGVVRDQLDGQLTRDPEAILNACPEEAIQLITVGDSAVKGSQS